MQSRDYRASIKIIILNLMRRKFPGLNKAQLDALSKEAAIAVHAKFYGAQVDGVASPIWRDDLKYQDMYEKCQPTKTAQDLLNE